MALAIRRGFSNRKHIGLYLFTFKVKRSLICHSRRLPCACSDIFQPLRGSEKTYLFKLSASLVWLSALFSTRALTVDNKVRGLRNFIPPRIKCGTFNLHD